MEGRIIDLSREAADERGLLAKGGGRVRVRYLGRAPRLGGGGTVLTAEARTPMATSSGPATAVSSAQAGPFWVQAGSFSDAGEARRIADSLSGWVRADAGAARFRVVVGPWDDANAAERGRQAVVARGYAGALLISGS